MNTEAVGDEVTSAKQAEKKVFVRLVGRQYVRITNISPEQKQFIQMKLRSWLKKKKGGIYGLNFDVHPEHQNWHHIFLQMKDAPIPDLVDYALTIQLIKDELDALIKRYPSLSLK